MKEAILSTLNRPEICQIAFGFNNVYINAMSFEDVKSALKKGKITAVHSKKLGSKRCKYQYTKNKFVLGFKNLSGDPDREALIVHESVHAVFDVKVKPMSVQQSEAAAYIAQCLFYYYRNQAALGGGMEVSFGDPILRAAWGVSKLCRHRSMLEPAELTPLYDAIATHKLYQDTYDDTDDYDGV